MSSSFLLRLEETGEQEMTQQEKQWLCERCEPEEAGLVTGVLAGENRIVIVNTKHTPPGPVHTSHALQRPWVMRIAAYWVILLWLAYTGREVFPEEEHDPKLGWKRIL